MDSLFFQRKRAGWVALVFFTTAFACSEPGHPPRLEAPSLLPAHQKNVRIATPKAAFGLIKHLARNYMDEGKGRSVIVEEPLAGNGPQLAYEAGLVNVAVGIEWRAEETANEFARTELVLALGPGIADRQLSLERLAQFVQPNEKITSSDGLIKYLSRSLHDPLTRLFKDAYPQLSIPILKAAQRVRVAADEDAMACPRKTAVKRNSFCLALEGNLRMYGIRPGLVDCRLDPAKFPSR